MKQLQAKKNGNWFVATEESRRRRRVIGMKDELIWYWNLFFFLACSANAAGTTGNIPLQHQFQPSLSIFPAAGHGCYDMLSVLPLQTLKAVGGGLKRFCLGGGFTPGTLHEPSPRPSALNHCFSKWRKEFNFRLKEVKPVPRGYSRNPRISQNYQRQGKTNNLILSFSLYKKKWGQNPTSWIVL